MSRPQYDDARHHSSNRVREFFAGWDAASFALFPAGFDQSYCLHGLGRESCKLPGVRPRKIVIDDGNSYWLVTGCMTGTVDGLAYSLRLSAQRVPAWPSTIGLGHGDMYWHRLIERLRRNSLREATVRGAVTDAPGD